MSDEKKEQPEETSATWAERPDALPVVLFGCDDPQEAARMYTAAMEGVGDPGQWIIGVEDVTSGEQYQYAIWSRPDGMILVKNYDYTVTGAEA